MYNPCGTGWPIPGTGRLLFAQTPPMFAALGEGTFAARPPCYVDRLVLDVARGVVVADEPVDRRVPYHSLAETTPHTVSPRPHDLAVRERLGVVLVSEHTLLVKVRLVAEEPFHYGLSDEVVRVIQIHFPSVRHQLSSRLCGLRQRPTVVQAVVQHCTLVRPSLRDLLRLLAPDHLHHVGRCVLTLPRGHHIPQLVVDVDHEILLAFRQPPLEVGALWSAVFRVFAHSVLFTVTRYRTVIEVGIYSGIMNEN